MRQVFGTTVFVLMYSLVYSIVWAVVAAHLSFFALLISVVSSPGLRASFLADPLSNLVGWWLFSLVNDVLDGTVFAFRLIVPVSAVALGLLFRYLSKDRVTTLNVLSIGLFTGLFQTLLVPWLIPPQEQAGPFQDRWVAVFVAPISSVAACFVAARASEKDGNSDKGEQTV